MQVLRLFSVWLHVVSVVVWLGGMCFLVLILLPVTRRPEFNPIASRLVHLVGLRFRWIGWICLVLLILSGVFNLVSLGFTWANVVDGSLWQGAFGHALGIKLILVAVVLVLSAVHDFYVGPRATALWGERPDDPRVVRWRRRAAWIGRINFVLALIIVALGISLIRGGIG